MYKSRRSRKIGRCVTNGQKLKIDINLSTIQKIERDVNSQVKCKKKSIE